MAKKNINEMSFRSSRGFRDGYQMKYQIIVMAIVTYFISDYLFDTIIFGPTRPTFITYTFFFDLSNYIGIGDSICITEMPFIIQIHKWKGK
jgi:sec-independent protein translocase protein TatC